MRLYFKSFYFESSFKLFLSNKFFSALDSSKPIYKQGLFLWLIHMTDTKLVNTHVLFSSAYYIYYPVYHISVWYTLRRFCPFVRNLFFFSLKIYVFSIFKIQNVIQVLNNFCYFCFDHSGIFLSEDQHFPLAQEKFVL